VAAVAAGWGSLPRMAPTDPRTDRRDDPPFARPAGERGDGMEGLPADLARDLVAPDGRRLPGRVGRVASWLQATPAELAGLAILLVGALVAAVVLWTGAAGRPAVLPDAGSADAGGAEAGGAEAGGAGAGGAGAGGAEAGGAGAGGAGAGAAAVGQPAGTVTDDAGGGRDAVGGEAGSAAGAGHGGPAAPDPVGPPPPTSVPAGPVTVHVSGAVHRPGLVELPAGSRVGHAIEAAGGLGPDADLARVNLARPLVDGEQVHVLRDGEDPPAVVAAPETLATPAPGTEGAAAVEPGPAGAGGSVADGRVDLNRATAAELETLPGIGPAKAAAIVEHRETHGPFSEPGDIRAVSGIGEKTFQQLADRITTG
jgi:competence protein ComEA